MRTLTAILGAAIWLAFIPAATPAAWKFVLPTDYQALLDSKRAFLRAKAADRQTEAVLQITCAPQGHLLSVFTSADLRDTLDVRYRIDGRPQKQSAFEIYGTNSISIHGLPPTEIGFAKRLSIEFMRQEGPTLLFIFDTAGANGAINKISCGW